MTHNHTCPTCRKTITCACPYWLDDTLCYECLQAELAEERKYNGTKEDIRTLTELLKHRTAERDRLLSIMETIAFNHDCDPRAEARHALEGKP